MKESSGLEFQNHSKENKITKKDLFIYALFVAMNYYEYGRYSKNDSPAIRALNRKFPTLLRNKCANTFNMVLKVYKAVIRFVEDNL